MKHTKSAGGVVVNRRGQVLVVSQHSTSWSLPKGRVEEGEDLLTAARREIYEEAGITQLELLKDLGSYTRYRLSAAGSESRSELKTIHLFLFKTDEDELKPVDPGNPQAIWVDKSDVPAILTHSKDAEFFLRNCLDQI